MYMYLFQPILIWKKKFLGLKTKHLFLSLIWIKFHSISKCETVELHLNDTPHYKNNNDKYVY